MVGPAPAYSAHTGAANHIQDRGNLLRTLNLVQNTSFNFSPSRNEVSQIGGTDSIVSRKVSSQPEISFSFSHILSDGRNEDMLGFCISGDNSAFLSGIHEKDKDRNFFLAISDDQSEDFNLQKDYSNIDVLAFGNCFPVSYSLNAAVGSLSTASVEYLAANVKAEKPNTAYTVVDAASNTDRAVSGVIPAINPENGQIATDEKTHGYLISSGSISEKGTINSGDIHYLRPGDIELTLPPMSAPGALISGNNKMHINQLAINIPIGRTSSVGFGSNYVTERKLSLPILADINFSAVANSFTQENLDNIFTKDEEYTFTITLRDPTSSAGGVPTNKAIELEVTQAKCQSQSISEAIGGNMEVNAAFTFECTPFTGLKFSGIAATQEGATWV